MDNGIVLSGIEVESFPGMTLKMLDDILSSSLVEKIS